MDDALRDLVERCVGPVRSVEDRSWPRAATRVWRVGAGGEIVWLKRHVHERKFRQEARAYQEVVPALRAAGVRVPLLLGRAEAWRALIVSHVPGSPADPSDLDAARRAGAVLAILHALPYDDVDPVSLSAAAVARVRSWKEQGRGIVDELAARAEAEIGDGSAFFGLQRRRCHRDYSARNWLVDGRDFGLIDFEHSGPDAWIVDLVRLVETADSDAIRAFLDGYGPIPPETADQLVRLLWLTEMATVVWARQHGDGPFEERARELLRRLDAGWTPLSAK